MPDPSLKLALFGVLGAMLCGVGCVEGMKASTTKHWRALFGLGASFAMFGQVVMFGFFYVLALR